eukprot:Amastigsp_a676496_131.p5 type:complete len:112 gc:universal Amastigsp_a676496_131:425-90(-)
MSQVNPFSSTTERASPPAIESPSNTSQSACSSSKRRYAAPSPVTPEPMMTIRSLDLDTRSEGNASVLPPFSTGSTSLLGVAPDDEYERSRSTSRSTPATAISPRLVFIVPP